MNIDRLQPPGIDTDTIKTTNSAPKFSFTIIIIIVIYLSRGRERTNVEAVRKSQLLDNNEMCIRNPMGVRNLNNGGYCGSTFVMKENHLDCGKVAEKGAKRTELRLHQELGNHEEGQQYSRNTVVGLLRSTE